ncbi:hypothetical protein QBL07_024360 (plasmid) [Gordonia rubripertincta]|uniref:Uncharacterized protein n=1 Tax=Gordonia rubripertincta NBRC 101908 TaxID=1077975 RepID=A0ABQ0HXB9_GORRU|nr:hypothetical protein GORBP_083_00630 [Gordonia rubripertincta NBRC 101908]
MCALQSVRLRGRVLEIGWGWCAMAGQILVTAPADVVEWECALAEAVRVLAPGGGRSWSGTTC